MSVFCSDIGCIGTGDGLPVTWAPAQAVSATEHYTHLDRLAFDFGAFPPV